MTETTVENRVTEAILKVDSFKANNQPSSGELDAYLNTLLRSLRSEEQNAQWNEKALYGNQINRLLGKISEYQIARSTVTLKTSTGLNTVKEDTKTWTWEVLKGLKNLLDNQVNAPVSIDTIKSEIDAISKSTWEERMMRVQALWSQLDHAGLIMTLTSGQHITLAEDRGTHSRSREIPQLKSNLELLINNSIDAKLLKQEDFQASILKGTAWFSDFIKVQIDPKNATADAYYDYLIKLSGVVIETPENFGKTISNINHSNKLDATQKAFLVSYQSDQYHGFDTTTVVNLIQKEINMGEQLKNSPEQKQVNATVDKVSQWWAQKEKEEIATNEPKWELTMEKFMSNPMSAISRYPWTSLWLIVGSIMKFGFSKTFMWILGIGIGTKIIWELGDTQLGKQIRQPLEEAKNELLWTNKSDSNAESNKEKKVKSETKIDTKNLVSSEKQAIDKVSNDSDLKKTFENQNPGQAEYLNFIHSELSGIPLDKLINDSESSIFAPWQTLDPAITAKIWNLTPSILKKVLRVYLGSSAKFSDTQAWTNPGSKEKTAFTAELEKHSINKDKFATTALSDAVTALYATKNVEVANSPEIMKKIKGYELVYNGVSQSKDNLDIKIDEYEDGGYVAAVNIKDPKSFNKLADKRDPIKIDFDKDGKLETTTLAITGYKGVFSQTDNYALTQQGTQILVSGPNAA